MCYRHSSPDVKKWQDEHGYMDMPEENCDNCRHMNYKRNEEESMSSQQFCTMGKFWTHAEAKCDEFERISCCPECGSVEYEDNFCQSCHDTDLLN